MNMQMQMSQLILTPRVAASSGPYLMVSQGTAAATPNPVPGFPPAPGFIAYHQNHPLVVAPPVPSFAPHQAFSQPPSEPVDEMPSSVSNTPDDSDAGWNMNRIQNTVSILVLLKTLPFSLQFFKLI